jgi:hypothetical protein
MNGFLIIKKRTTASNRKLDSSSLVDGAPDETEIIQEKLSPNIRTFDFPFFFLFSVVIPARKKIKEAFFFAGILSSQHALLNSLLVRQECEQVGRR